MLFAAGGVGAGVFEGVLQIAGGDFESGSDAEEQADGESEQEGPGEGCCHRYGRC